MDMDEAMAKYTDDFTNMDHRSSVDGGDPSPLPPPNSTVPITHAPFTITPHTAAGSRGDCFVIHYNAPVEL
jgi:hypothetical protein